MVTVRFFGFIRLQIKINKIQLAATRLDYLLKLISISYQEIDLKDLKKSVILVNGKNIHHLKLFKTKLQDGDIIDIMSPAAGG